VLGAVVRLLSEASAVHACFVYLLDREGRRLELGAASPPYAGLVGRIGLDRGEGLAWWALDHREPAFIRDHALDDPRFKYVEELDEERFQSLVSIPIVNGRGDGIGVITLHTEAPREFTPGEVDFLVSSASLVAGAIENARLYEAMGRRVAELEQLMELGEAVAAAETHAELAPAVVEGARALLGATAVHLYVLEPESERLRLQSSAPAGAAAAAALGLNELGPELGRRGRAPRVAVALVAGGELLGALVAEGTRELDLARTVANHAAVAIKKIDVIERLAEKNAITDFFELLAAGKAAPDLPARAARLGVDLDAPYLVLAAAPAGDALERALARAGPRPLFDRRGNVTRALVRIPSAGAAALGERIAAVTAELDGNVAVGVSNPCTGLASFAAGFEEAGHALLGTGILRGRPRVLAYEDLGAYKYLLRMSLDPGGRDTHRDALARLADYDATHSTALLRTLEEFLARRGTIGATSEALFIHPNTLRQRLRRIMELTGIDLRREDWLMVEIAVKLTTLERTLQASDDMRDRPSV
jgi:GAF domain-containing protein